MQFTKDYTEVRLATKQSNRNIKLNDRVAVVTDSGQEIGRGVVTYTAERTEVMFDKGGGGMFPNRFIKPID